MTRLAQPFAASVAAAADLPVDEVLAQLGAPPKPEMGHLAFPCFGLATCSHSTSVGKRTVSPRCSLSQRQ